MNRDQVAILLAKASAAYPNQAPELSKNNQIFEVWVERLAQIDPQRALNNLDVHIDSNRFFPTIADVVRHDPSQFVDHFQQKLETQQYLEQRKEWEQKAITCPPHLMRQQLKSGESDV
jgi:hypothetical protein